MKVKIAEITSKMKLVLTSKGFSKANTDFLIDMYLGGELRGHTSHGLASFPGFIKQDFSLLPEPEVVKATSAVFVIDAKSNPGAVVGKRAADEAMKRAKTEVIGTAIIKNMESWLRPGAIAEYIANKGFVALVFNSGGEVSIAPPGGYDPVVGTNPIAFGIPDKKGALVVDMATSKRAKGQIRLANKLGTSLPPDSFYDKQGTITLDPKEAYSLLSFGEYKGFALALFVEILCGSLVGMPMMLEGDPSNTSYGGKTPKRGGFILVIDPRQTTDLEGFKSANTELIEKIKATSKLPGEEIRIPGEQAGELQAASLNEGEIEIPDELWQELRSL